MEWIVSVIGAANSLTPLAIIGLLVMILLLQAKNKREVSSISENHLSDMPEIAETLRRIEVKLTEEFSFIRAKLTNGGPRV